MMSNVSNVSDGSKDPSDTYPGLDGGGNDVDPIVITSIAVTTMTLETTTPSSSTVMVLSPNTGISSISAAATDPTTSPGPFADTSSDTVSFATTQTGSSSFSTSLSLSTEEIYGSFSDQSLTSFTPVSPTDTLSMETSTASAGYNSAYTPTRILSVATTLVASSTHRSSGNTSAAAVSATSTPTDGDASSHRKNATVPIAATIVALITVTLIVCLCLFWRRRQKVRMRQEAHIEGEIKQGTGQAFGEGVDETSAAETEEQQQQRGDTFIASGGKPRPVVPPLLIAKHNRSTMQERSPDFSATVEDPFRTPPNETTQQREFPAGPDEFRTSQIGLAITTSHARNASNISVADSIRTVLHHASHKLSNPFRDPDKHTSRESLIQSQPPTQNIPYAFRHASKGVKGLHRDETSTKQDPQGAVTGRDETLVKSGTPPEDLARKWIEVLRLEAAQAQEAANQAAQKAAELKMIGDLKDKDGDGMSEHEDVEGGR